MSAIPGGAIGFEIKGTATGPGGFNKAVDDARARVVRLSKEVSRTKVVVPVSIDTKRVQADANETKRIIRDVNREADQLFKARQRARATAAGTSGRRGGGGDDDIFGMGRMRGGLAGAVTAVAAVRALGEGFEALSRGMDDGTASFRTFIEGFIRGIPIVGDFTGKLGDLITKANEMRLLRKAGLVPFEEANRDSPFTTTMKDDRRRRETLDERLSDAEAEQVRRNELEGVSGPDLERRRIRQQAQERIEKLGGELSEADKIQESGPRNTARERIMALQAEATEDMERALRAVDAEEGIKKLGEAANEWFDSLSERVKGEAKKERLRVKEAGKRAEEIRGEDDDFLRDLSKKEENKLRIEERKLQKELKVLDDSPRIAGAGGIASSSAQLQSWSGMQNRDTPAERQRATIIERLEQIRDKKFEALTS